MKNTFKATALAVMMALSSSAFAEKIGFLEQEYVIENHPLFAKNSDFVKMVEKENALLTKERADLAKEEEQLVKEVERLTQREQELAKDLPKRYQELEQVKGSLKESNFKKKKAELDAIAQKFQKEVEEFQAKYTKFSDKQKAFEQKINETEQKITAEQAKVRRKVIEDVKAKIKAVAKKDGYDWIIDANIVFYAKNQEKFDLSNTIIKAVGGQVPAKK